MARDGTGQYNLPTGPVVNATAIDPNDENSTRADIATALTGSLARDGQGAMTGALPMGGNSVTGMANGASRTAAASVGQLQDGAVLWGGTAGGTANALTLTLSPVITAYAAGQRFAFIAPSLNTGATTLNINSVGATAVVTPAGAACVGNEIRAGTLVHVVHDGTSWRLINVASQPLGTTTAGVGQFVSANTATGGSFSLPAGGTWEWQRVAFINSTGTYVAGQAAIGINAGGDEICPAIAGWDWIGWAKRIT